MNKTVYVHEPMTPDRQARYMRLVLYLISKRKWKNGHLTNLASETLSRVTCTPEPKKADPRPKHRQKTPEEIEATRRAAWCLVSKGGKP